MYNEITLNLMEFFDSTCFWPRLFMKTLTHPTSYVRSKLARHIFGYGRAAVGNSAKVATVFILLLTNNWLNYMRAYEQTQNLLRCNRQYLSLNSA